VEAEVMVEIVIRTSERGWMQALANAYKERAPLLLIDDANVGIDPSTQTLFEMARHARLSTRELASVCVALGMSAVGIGMIVFAFIDPEPTSKLGLLIGGGAVCVFSGGYTAIHILTRHRPPHVKVGLGGIEISWS
jgi:hypothetical protein